MTGWCINNWNGGGRKWSWTVWSTTATFVWRDREKPMKIWQASWYHGQYSQQVLLSEPIPSVDLYNIIHPVTRSTLFINQSTSVCPYPSRCHNALQVHILHTNNCHHTHSSIYLHSPSSSKVHLCWCKCSVKSRMMGLILQWRPNNNTPNGSPQFTQVPVQDWTAFIIPSSYNLCISPLSNTIPKKCDFQGQL